MRESLPALHRYLRLRKRVLGLDELRMYDLYVPLVPDVDFGVPYEEAKRMVKAGLVPLGEEYQAALDDCFNGRWIDVYENAGEDVRRLRAHASTASTRTCSSTTRATIYDVFTIAHELGHAMHSHFTLATQPYIYSNYSIFVAEVASTVNEALLVNYLLDSEIDPARRLYILNHYLEQFRTTCSGRRCLPSLKRSPTSKWRKGGALTADCLCEMYRSLNLDYYGAGSDVDPEIDIEWARIPHFYSAFYVYKYATGFSAANALGRRHLVRQAGAPSSGTSIS